MLKTRYVQGALWVYFLALAFQQAYLRKKPQLCTIFHLCFENLKEKFKEKQRAISNNSQGLPSNHLYLLCFLTPILLCIHLISSPKQIVTHLFVINAN